MTSEKESMPIDLFVNKEVADSCEPNCTETINDRVMSQAHQLAQIYMANHDMMPGMIGMETTVSIEMDATCPGGRRKLLGGFKCALETTCSLQADSRRPGHIED